MKIFVLCALVSLALVGCASSDPTFGETLEERGGAYKDVGKRWTKGVSLIEDGEARMEKGRKQIKKGRALINDGEDNIERGEDMLEKGKRLKKEAEEENQMLQKQGM